MDLTSLTDAEWCLDAILRAETFERLLGLAACFILDGDASYKATPVFAAVRQAYAAKVHFLGFSSENIRTSASRDPVRGIDDYIANGWSDIGQHGFITEADLASMNSIFLRPDDTANPPHRKTVSAVKAGSGAPNTRSLFE